MIGIFARIGLSLSFYFLSVSQESGNWKIGGNIHFEERSAMDYLGTVEINRITRDILHETLPIEEDSCNANAKVLLKEEQGHLFIRHYEGKSRPGIGEEMHATLLYPTKHLENNHETLREICTNLSLSVDVAPTLEQVSEAYHKIIPHDLRLEISGIMHWENPRSDVIVAMLSVKGRSEIVNNEGLPVSGNSLHMTLINLDASLTQDHVRSILTKLEKKLVGKRIKVHEVNGLADLEFGISGSPKRLRPLG